MKWCHPAHHGRLAASCHLGTHRGGFTLVELAVTVMIVGILAGIAVPAMRDAIYKADASRLAQDAHTISGAAYNYLMDNNRFPPNTAYGSIPAGLEEYLPEDFRFSYKGVRYRWYPMTYPNSDNVWGTRFVGLVMFDYAEEPGIGQAMYSYSGPLAYWWATYFYFYYLG